MANNEECLICGSQLEYLEKSEKMECSICHRVEKSKTRCVDGHYVCNKCHTKGMDKLISICKESKSKNPIEIMNFLMDQEFSHMHGPEHHVMVGSALLTAYKNAGADINLEDALVEMMARGQEVPGGTCGFWGACGAGISSGIFISIITETTPLKKDTWGLGNKMTANSLQAIGEIGGPRCCKRTSYTSILEAIDFVKENLGIEMEKSEIICKYYPNNNQCIGKRCPYFPANHKIKVNN